MFGITKLKNELKNCKMTLEVTETLWRASYNAIYSMYREGLITQDQLTEYGVRAREIQRKLEIEQKGYETIKVKRIEF